MKVSALFLPSSWEKELTNSDHFDQMQKHEEQWFRNDYNIRKARVIKWPNANICHLVNAEDEKRKADKDKPLVYIKA